MERISIRLKKPKPVVITLLIVLATSFQLNAQDSPSLTLNDAVKLALEKYPSVQAASLETSRQSALKRGAIEIPKTDVSLLYGQYNSIQQDNNITISQNLPFPTVFTSQRSLSKAFITSAEYREKMTRNEVVFQVRMIFNQLLYIKERQKILEQQDSLFTDLSRVAELYYKTGEGTLLAKTSAETQLLEIKNQLSRNEVDLKMAINQLQLITQSTQVTDVEGPLDSFLAIPEVDSGTWSGNPSLAFSKQQVEIAEQKRKVEVARAFPDLKVGYFSQTLVGTQNTEGQDQYFGSDKRFQGFQVGVSIPLWFTTQTSKTKAASIAVDVAQKEHETYTIVMSQQYNQAVQEMQKNQTSLEYYKGSALKTADLLASQSNKAFKSGEADYTTLLFNMRQVLAIREGYLSALFQYNQSNITLQYLTGNY